MSIFDLHEQNDEIDKKIIAGLERLSQVFKALLWEKAKEQQLSPIQIQLLIFIHYHAADKSSISYLSEEFNITKATVSEAIKVLEQKRLVAKTGDQLDGRRYSISLTAKGKKVVKETEDYTAPFAGWITGMPGAQKEHLWKSISDLIRVMNRIGVISVQRTCYTCSHYANAGGIHFCGLLQQQLAIADIRIDCAEHELQ